LRGICGRTNVFVMHRHSVVWNAERHVSSAFVILSFCRINDRGKKRRPLTIHLITAPLCGYSITRAARPLVNIRERNVPIRSPKAEQWSTIRATSGRGLEAEVSPSRRGHGHQHERSHDIKPAPASLSLNITSNSTIPRGVSSSSWASGLLINQRLRQLRITIHQIRDSVWPRDTARPPCWHDSEFGFAGPLSIVSTSHRYFAIKAPTCGNPARCGYRWGSASHDSTIADIKRNSALLRSTIQRSRG
jgi:hypothetical protein